MNATIKVFEDPKIGAMVFTSEEQIPSDEPLQIGEHGILDTGETIPQGFFIELLLPEKLRCVVNQKNVGTDRGKYHNLAITALEASGGVRKFVMIQPINVHKAGSEVWTIWHDPRSIKTNRIDCWLLSEDGELGLFQVGVITHDNGAIFRLLGEWRWKGRIFTDTSLGFVAKPEHPKWGPALIEPKESRNGILHDPCFKELLESAKITPWKGSRQELTVSIQKVPRLRARVQWYIPFAGQSGQGIAILHDGSSVWFHGADTMDEPDEDGVKRYYRNDLLSYEGVPQKWGIKSGAPPKIVGVRRERN